MAIQTRYVYIISYILPVTDVIFLTLYLITFYHLTGFMGGLPTEVGKNYLIVCNLIWLLSSAMTGLYTVNGAEKSKQLYIRTLKSILLHAVMFCIYLVFSGSNHFSIALILIFYAAFAFVFLTCRLLGSELHNIFLDKDKASKKVAILGSNDTAVKFSSYLLHQRNLDFYGFLGNDESMYTTKDGLLSTDMDQIFSEALKYGVTDIYVAVAMSRIAEVTTLIHEADRNCIRLKFIPDLSNTLMEPYTMSYIGNQFPVISLSKGSMEKPEYRFGKQVSDIAFSMLLILLIFIWLFPALSKVIKSDRKGPLSYQEPRQPSPRHPEFSSGPPPSRHPAEFVTPATSGNRRLQAPRPPQIRPGITPQRAAQPRYTEIIQYPGRYLIAFF
jgi:putative colanic acid biosynthesis UDP-glucose lipid carrier transferase